jgi:hypothetical protein
MQGTEPGWLIETSAMQLADTLMLQGLGDSRSREIPYR